MNKQTHVKSKTISETNESYGRVVGGDYGSLGWAEWLPRQPQGPNLDSSEWVIQVGFFLSPKAATVSLGEVGERVNPQ